MIKKALLSKMRQDQNLVLLSTHIMQEVEAVCDRVIIINHGKIVADAKIGEMQQMAGKMGIKQTSEHKEGIGLEELFF